MKLHKEKIEYEGENFDWNVSVVLKENITGNKIYRDIYTMAETDSQESWEKTRQSLAVKRGRIRQALGYDEWWFKKHDHLRNVVERQVEEILESEDIQMKQEIIDRLTEELKSEVEETSIEEVVEDV